MGSAKKHNKRLKRDCQPVVRCQPLSRALCILSDLVTIRRAHHASIIALNFMQK